MPTPVMKSFAKQAHMKPKKVEALWNIAEKIAKKKYDIDQDSSRYWPIVVGITKKLLGLGKTEDKVEEDVITTTNIGDATFANKIGEPAQRIDGDKQPIKAIITKKKKYKKVIEEMIKTLSKEKFDVLIEDALKYYSSQQLTEEDVVDFALESIQKRFNLTTQLEGE